MAVWGIDPGGIGCLVSISANRCDIVEQIFAPNRPPHWFSVGKWVNDNVWPHAVFVESVHALPGNGKSTMFTFGKNTGIIHGMLYAHQIPFMEVVPDKWRMVFGLAGRKYSGTKSQQRSARKKDHLEVAKNIFPGVKLTQETCDAYLIAQYAWLMTFGTNEDRARYQRRNQELEFRKGTGIIRSEIE